MKYIGLIFLALLVTVSTVFAQSVSVSPSRLYFNVTPGSYKSQQIRVVNNGTKPQTFTVNFADFNSPGKDGKTKVVKDGKTEHGMSDWLTASPSFFEIQPGEMKDVEILLQLPNTPDANTVRWAVASIKLARENTGPTEKGKNVTGMAIIPTFSFVVHLFQTPSNVSFKEVVIDTFYRDMSVGDSLVLLKMLTRNTGDAIADCAPYLNVVNLKTGESDKIEHRGYTILPGGVRELKFYMPRTFKKGIYDVLGVVDYGSETNIAGFGLEVKITKDLKPPPAVIKKIKNEEEINSDDVPKPETPKPKK